MKTRFMLLTFAALFGAAALAGAATDPVPAVSPAAPACATQASTLNLPGLLPNAIFASTVCGTCSQNPCRNQTVGTVCFSFNRRGSCLSPDDTTCPGTTAPNCQCYVGPL